MEANFVSGLDDHSRLLRNCLNRMARHKPARLDSETLKKLEQTRHANLAAEHASRNSARRFLAAERPEPHRYRIKIHTKGAQNFLRHDHPFVAERRAATAASLRRRFSSRQVKTTARRAL
jgi:hypothetical protein